MEHLYQKRKEQRNFIRLKIITNRNLNFITAVRPDSTITDLANRALNVYLQLSNQFGSKKQLTVAAVKQGRYFMPKSEYVSSLLSQDEQIEVIIVKAKPKFPNQVIPTTEHSFAQYTKHIKSFSQQKTKLPKNRLIQELKKQHQKYSQEISSSKSQLQQSKRQRKKKKRAQKEQQKNKINKINKIQQNQQAQKDQNKQHKQNQSQAKHQNKEAQQRKSQVKMYQTQSKQIINNNVSQSSITNHMPKEANENNSSVPNLQVPITAFRKKSVEQEIQKLQYQSLRKKIKPDLPQSQSKKQVPQKDRQQYMRSSQKIAALQLSSVQSPKITFHSQKLQSPKVIYLSDPIRKNSNDLKVPLQKEKDKLKSPALLPRSSPKMTFSEPSFNKQLLNKINQTVGISSKQKIKQLKKQQIDLLQLSSPKTSKEQQKKSLKRDSSESQTQKKEAQTSKKTQPEIIQQQSSQSEQDVNLNGRRSSNSRYSGRNQSESNNSQQNVNRQISTKSSTRDKFYEIQMKINKFKLQDSSDEEQ